MQYVANRSMLPSRRSIITPLVALVLGAGAAVGGYALTEDTVQAPAKVVFVDTPGPGQGVRGIDDTAKSPAIDSTPKVVVPYLSHGVGAQSTDTTPKVAPHLTHGGPPANEADSVDRTDPHGTAAVIHGR